jgi:maltose phosphorylase
MIVEKGFHPDRAEVSESVFSLGNEHMGVRGYFEEGFSGPRMLGSYLNGIFEEAPIQHPMLFKALATRITYLVNTVDWLHTRLALDGQELDLGKSKFSDFERRLDMRTGTLTRSFVWHVGAKRLRVTFLRFLSMAQPNLGGQRLTLEALNFSGQVELVMGLDFSIMQYSDKANLWQTLRREQSGDLWAIMARTRRSCHRVLSAMRVEAQGLAPAAPVSGEQFVGGRFAVDLAQGKPASVDRLAANFGERCTTTPDDEVWSRSIAAARKLLDTTFDRALAAHSDYWKRTWETLDISVEGDPENEQGIRFCVFQLHQTYHGFDPSLNVSAKGLTGEAYWGATWWDTETYCLPFYMFNNPKAARNLLGYRYTTLQGAVERAGQKDCRGARYPMATIDGTEIVGVWQHGDLEIHVSAAVAYGIWHYVHVTGDKGFLYGPGIEMLLQIARYYASRGQWAPNGDFGFWGVMGADEFHMMCHNNQYTNVMARKSMQWALDTMAEMRRRAPRELAKVIRKVCLKDDEPRAWRRMISKMRDLTDKRTGLIEQHDGYFDMPHLDLDKVPPTDFPLYKNWAYTRIFRWDMIKQPDVLLLLFLFSQEYPLKAKKVNYEYYEPRCSHESSLSPGIHSILAAELGKHKQAYDYSLHAARLDLDDYNRNTSEGLHTTSMAAAWLLLVYGYGGMRSDGDVLSFNPSMPRKWTSFSFRVLYRDSVLGMKVSRETVSMRVHSGPPVAVRLLGKPAKVTSEGVTVPLPRERRA